MGEPCEPRWGRNETSIELWIKGLKGDTSNHRFLFVAGKAAVLQAIARDNVKIQMCAGDAMQGTSSNQPGHFMRGLRLSRAALPETGVVKPLKFLIAGGYRQRSQLHICHF